MAPAHMLQGHERGVHGHPAEAVQLLAGVQQAVDLRVHDAGPFLQPAIATGGDHRPLGVYRDCSDGDASLPATGAGFLECCNHVLVHDCTTYVPGSGWVAGKSSVYPDANP